MHLTANGHPLDTGSDRFGELEPMNHLLGDEAGLREAMDDRGHLFLRELLDPDVVSAARIEVLRKYAILGEIDDRRPIDDAIAGDGAGVSTANVRAFSESVRNGAHYLAVTDAPELLAVNRALLGGDVRSFDMRWPRFVRPGEGCGFHCDGPYMNRGTSRIFSSWIPLGRIDRHEGALILLEDSHRSQRLLDGYLRADADRDGLTWLDDDPVAVQHAYGKRWLTTDFRPGDVLLFGMHTLHGAIDNASSEGRCRLSSDSRYQRVDEPADPRWNGADFDGHGGRRVFYPGLGQWNNEDFQDEWKDVDERGRLRLRGTTT
jgi:ectoine hydroxylase-related dioxygenase (phytanoyl-CoA dioxygenase family)